MAELKNIRIAVSGLYDYAYEELPSLRVPLPHQGAPSWVEEKRIYKVYRPAPVLAAACDKFKMLPLTHHHPRTPVDGQNFRDLALGYTGENPWVDYLEDKNEVGIRSTLMLYDDEALKAYDNGEVQLSPGYIAIFEWQKGIAPNGEEYDIVMKEITDVNHLAILPAGRGGDSAVVLDSAPKLETVFDIARKTHENVNEDGAPVGNDNASKDHVKEEDTRKYKPENMKNLSDNIDTILNGSEEEKEKLKHTYFNVGKTNDTLKENGITGDYLTISYGVISHHKGKDDDHKLSVEEWNDVIKELQKPPVMISKYKNDFNVFLNIKRDNKNALVGVKIVQNGRDSQINSVQTVFYKDMQKIDSDNIVYLNKKNVADCHFLLSPIDNTRQPATHNKTITDNDVKVKSIFDIARGSVFDLASAKMTIKV